MGFAVPKGDEGFGFGHEPLESDPQVALQQGSSRCRLDTGIHSQPTRFGGLGHYPE